MDLLKKLCELHAPSGEEVHMARFITDYLEANPQLFKYKPEVIQGPELQDCLIIKFGNPRTAVFAHMDSVGFTVRYQNQLVAIGGPEVQTGYALKGEDDFGPIECELEVSKDNQLFYKFGRAIATGTSLTFQCNFREDKDYVTSCYLDNRLGIYNALKLAETLQDGVIVFSAWEEHGGGSVPYLGKYIYEKWGIKQALISDITWITDGVHPGDGVVISMRDQHIPRKSFVNKVINIAAEHGVPYQLEVEGAGSSDGRELQQAPIPFDWCFVGAAEQNVHSPDEKVHKNDIKNMLELYKILMTEL
ncbi:MAG: M20/M25/M40 family metallo-hydrolase [Fulvivirga sp.]|nr:M20/M25/M40 family metallo-hydrolase [Fulvivirga sp.]